MFFVFQNSFRCTIYNDIYQGVIVFVFRNRRVIYQEEQTTTLVLLFLLFLFLLFNHMKMGRFNIETCRSTDKANIKIFSFDFLSFSIIVIGNCFCPKILSK